MKTIILTTILALGLVPGLSQKAEARNPSPQYQIIIVGYQECGTPIYMVRYLCGYDCYGRPIWRIRKACRDEINRYRKKCGSSSYRGYAGYGQSRISYTSSGGRNHSYRYHSRSRDRCRGW